MVVWDSLQRELGEINMKAMLDYVGYRSEVEIKDGEDIVASMEDDTLKLVISAFAHIVMWGGNFHSLFSPSFMASVQAVCPGIRTLDLRERTIVENFGHYCELVAQAHGVFHYPA